MRVVELGKYYHPYQGGIESHLRVLSEQIRARVELEVIVHNVGPKTVHERVADVSVTRCASFGVVASVALSPTMPLELSRRSYDVLHLHLPHPAGAASYLAALKPKAHRLVVTYHSDVVRQKLLMRLYAPLVERVLDRADVVIATSPSLLEHSAVLRRFAHKCRVVPYGIDLDLFRRTPEHTRAAEKLRARHGTRRVILAVGRLIYYKGFEVAIRALERLPDVDLVIVGQGPLRKPLEDLAKTLGVAGRVNFEGERLNEEIVPYYLASDVYVLPSVAPSEAFGIVQIEAMACGLPVVNTSLPSGVPYVSRDGETGFTVPPGDAGALASAVSRLLSDDALRRRLGDAGRERAHAEFSKETLALRILDAYNAPASDAQKSRIFA
jgi:rhamnosyl/mannosyltransferase